MTEYRYEPKLLTPLQRDRGRVNALFLLKPVGFVSNAQRHAIAIRPGDDPGAKIDDLNVVFARRNIAPVSEEDREKLAKDCDEAFADEALIAEARNVEKEKAASLKKDHERREQKAAQRKAEFDAAVKAAVAELQAEGEGP